MTEDQPSTGRLFRAASVDDEVHTDAIPALPSERPRVEDVLPDAAFRAEVSDLSLAVEEVATPAPTPAESLPQPPAALGPDTGLSTLLVWLVVVGVTLVMAVADVLVRKQGIGWVTGVGLIAATIYVAMASQRATMWWSVIAPPLTIALAAVTVGQATLARTGSFWLSQSLNLYDSLSRTAPFTVAAVITALVICLVRRRRATSVQQP